MEQNVERIVDTTFASAEKAKVNAADAFEEAARRLRETSMTGKGEDVKAILHDIESKTNQLKAEVDKKVAPLEDFVYEHPFMTIAIALGAGFLIGSLVIASRRD